MPNEHLDLTHYRKAIEDLRRGGSSEFELNLTCWLGERADRLVAEIDRLRAELDTAKAEPRRPTTLSRETLGRIVREEWIRWAELQPNPKSSWLVPWEDLPENDREADRMIGETVAAFVAGTQAGPPRPAAIVWTREKPTEPGWYWSRGGIFGPGPAVVAEIAIHRGPPPLLAVRWGGLWQALGDGEWAGPIPYPVGPARAAEGEGGRDEG